MSQRSHPILSVNSVLSWKARYVTGHRLQQFRTLTVNQKSAAMPELRYFSSYLPIDSTKALLNPTKDLHVLRPAFCHCSDHKLFLRSDIFLCCLWHFLKNSFLSFLVLIFSSQKQIHMSYFWKEHKLSIGLEKCYFDSCIITDIFKTWIGPFSS